MTDEQLIHALADDLLPSEIARKMEMSVRQVLAVLKQKNKGEKRLTIAQIQRAMGSEPFTLIDLADELSVDVTHARSRLHVMERKGLLRKVGETKGKRQQTAALYQFGA